MAFCRCFTTAATGWRGKQQPCRLDGLGTHWRKQGPSCTVFEPRRPVRQAQMVPWNWHVWRLDGVAPTATSGKSIRSTPPQLTVSCQGRPWQPLLQIQVQPSLPTQQCLSGFGSINWKSMGSVSTITNHLRTGPLNVKASTTLATLFRHQIRAHFYVTTF